jgi:hypothetical protein
MIWINLVVYFFITVTPADKYEVVGTYSISRKGRYNSTSWSTTTIKLNCDSTVSFTTRTHGGLNSWNGTWTSDKDTLTVEIKPIITEDSKEYFGRWDKVTRFLIRRNKLTTIDMNGNLTKENFKRIEEKDCF